jgi:hypothetical protein
MCVLGIFKRPFMVNDYEFMRQVNKIWVIFWIKIQISNSHLANGIGHISINEKWTILIS